MANKYLLIKLLILSELSTMTHPSLVALHGMAHSLTELDKAVVGHGGEFWQNVVHWRREWQTASAFLPWESHEQYQKAKDMTLKDDPLSPGW